MILYLDTSALVKLFINETYSELVREYYNNCRVVATSNIAYVEFNSALSRIYREGLIDFQNLQNIRNNFDNLWNFYKIINFDDNIIQKATKLLYETELRAFDSIHLASADFLRENTKDNVYFACFDKKLVMSANFIGLKVLNNQN